MHFSAVTKLIETFGITALPKILCTRCIILVFYVLPGRYHITERYLWAVKFSTLSGAGRIKEEALA